MSVRPTLDFERQLQKGLADEEQPFFLKICQNEKKNENKSSKNK